MTLDEAIKHAEEVANANERLCETVRPAMQLSDYGKCAEEHRQLVEWLKDYKRLKEQEPCDDVLCYTNLKENAELIAKILDADARGEVFLDKIRAEIESHIIDSNGLDFNSALCIAIEIIDKYTTESEK